jgi:hypothetical protein
VYAEIKIACPNCTAQIALAPSEIVCVRYKPIEGSFYQFRCLNCGQHQTKGADKKVIALLETGGVRILDVIVEAHKSGPVLTEDDLIELGQEMSDL